MRALSFIVAVPFALLAFVSGVAGKACEGAHDLCTAVGVGLLRKGGW